MAKPTDVLRLPLPDAHLHANLTLQKSVTTQPFPINVPLQHGVWISVNDKEVYVAFAAGVLVADEVGLRLTDESTAPYFFPLSNAADLYLRSKDNAKVFVVAA